MGGLYLADQFDTGNNEAALLLLEEEEEEDDDNFVSCLALSA